MNFLTAREVDLYDLQRLWQEELQVKNLSLSSDDDDSDWGGRGKEDEPEVEMEVEVKLDQGTKIEYEDCVRRKWRHGLKRRYEAEYKQYKVLCRKQEVEPWMRRFLWLRVCGLIPETVEYRKGERQYQFLLKKIMACPGCKELKHDHIPTFGALTKSTDLETLFTSHYLSKYGQVACKRILLALEKECFIPYCPLLPHLICLLLLFVNEFEAFHICRHLVKESQTRRNRWKFERTSTGYDTFFYIPTDLSGWKAIEYSLLDCLDKLANKGMNSLEALTFETENNKKIAENIVPNTIQEDIEVSFDEKEGMHFDTSIRTESKKEERCGNEHNDGLTDYIKCCFHGVFTNVLRLRHVIRILDCFIMEGFIVLVQVAVSIIKKYGNGHNKNVEEYLTRTFLRDRFQNKMKFSDGIIRVECDDEKEDSGSSESDDKVEADAMSQTNNLTISANEKVNAEENPRANFRRRYSMSFRRSRKGIDSIPVEATSGKHPRRRSVFATSFSSRNFSFRENKSDDSMLDSTSPRSSTSERARLRVSSISSMAKSFRSLGSRSNSIGSNTSMDAWILRDSRESNILMDDIAFDDIMRSIFCGKLRHLETRQLTHAEEEYNHQVTISQQQQRCKNTLGESKHMESRLVTNELYNRLTVISRPSSISIHFPQEVLSESDILNSAEDMTTMLKWLPDKEKVKCSQLQVVYNPRKHGFGLDQLYRRCNDRTTGACILLVEDFNGAVFGAFCSDALRLSKKEFGGNAVGDESCFVFRLSPSESANVWKFQKEQLQASGKLDGKNHHQFATCLKKSLCFGTISTGLTKEDKHVVFGPALWLNEDISQGHTGRTTTFGNEPLCAAGGHGHSNENHAYFQIKSVEVLALPVY